MATSVFIWPGAAGGSFTGQSIGPAADNTAAPPFTFLGDLDTGVGSSAADTVNLVTGGTSRLTLTSTAATFAASVIGSFTNSALATTSTDGLFIQNATAATGGATVQMSPRFRLRGTAWDTSASKTVDFFMENLPATAATPTGTLKFGYSLNGAAATYPMTLTSAGLLTLTSGSNTAYLLPDSADTLALRNGTTSQTLSLYGTFTSATSYERVETTVSAGNFLIWTRAGSGGGSARALEFGTDTTRRWSIGASTGHFLAASDNAYDIGATSATRPRSLYLGTSLFVQGANAQSVAIQQLTELTTIAAAATTDTTIQMPAGAIVMAVNVRVTTVIPTAATFTVGDSGSAARFSTAAVSTAATSTDAGTKAGAYYNASALSIRITPNLTPADNTGRLRVTIYYFLSTPPTS